MKFIGFDLDNTIFNYAPAIERIRVDREELRGFMQGSKAELKQSIVEIFGEDYWTELQGHLYTEYVDFVHVDPQFIDLLKVIESRGWRSSIISHKSIFPFLGPRLDMREYALAKLESLKITSLLSDGIHFFESKEQKISYINDLEPDFFIDDLLEILMALSPNINCIQLTTRSSLAQSDIIFASSWEEVCRLVTENG